MSQGYFSHFTDWHISCWPILFGPYPTFQFYSGQRQTILLGKERRLWQERVKIITVCSPWPQNVKTINYCRNLLLNIVCTSASFHPSQLTFGMQISLLFLIIVQNFLHKNRSNLTNLPNVEVKYTGYTWLTSNFVWIFWEHFLLFKSLFLTCVKGQLAKVSFSK